VQEVDEHLDVVVDLKPIEGEILDAIPIASGPTIGAGGHVIYAFISEDNIPHVGTLADIEPILRAFIARCSDRPAISLQIMELIGTLEEKRTARALMRRGVVEESGATAAHAFGKSILYTILWHHLLSADTDAEAARRILRSRTRIGLKASADGTVTLDLSVLDPKDYARTSEAALVAELETELRHVIGTTASERIADIQESARRDELHYAQSERARAALKAISITARQEERLAILLDNIVQDRAVGLQMLEAYFSDKAKYATAALSDLRTILAEDHSTNLVDPGVDAVTLVRLIERRFAKGMPSNRAVLMYYMAKHLAKYPDVRKYLSGRWKNSYSYAFNPFRKELDELLG
jgi:hypothetical protein